MTTRQQAARDFVKTWVIKDGKEDAERQTFWNDLLQRVYGLTPSASESAIVRHLFELYEKMSQSK
ncbi:hypothetical protein [Pediococcus pentosaceus]